MSRGLAFGTAVHRRWSLPVPSQRFQLIWMSAFAITDRAELLRYRTKLQCELRLSEIRFEKAVPGIERVQAERELANLRVRMREIEWQLANRYRRS
jgi:hypothetical protein